MSDTTRAPLAADSSRWDSARRSGDGGRDGAALTALRVTTYVLTSLASLLFIAVVIYAGVKVNQVQNALEGFTSGFGGDSFGSSAPGLGSTEPAPFEFAPDTVPGIAEDDYAGMRANIAANGGQPSSSAESQYLFACETGVLPAADCP